MGVSFDLVLKGKEVLTKHYMCFGFLNCFPHSTYNYENVSDPHGRNIRDIVRDHGGIVRTSDVRFVDFDPAYSLRRDIWRKYEVRGTTVTAVPDGSRVNTNSPMVLKTYLKEMRNLLADMPWFKDSFKVRPFKKRIRAHVTQSLEADKLIMGLFMFRNLCNFEWATHYLDLRAEGIRPRFAFTMSSLISKQPPSYFRPEVEYHTIHGGEGAYFNQHTFGKAGLTRFLKQDINDQPWYQEEFRSTDHGYMRDSHFSEDEIVFNPDCDQQDFDEWDMGSDATYFRRMVDCFSYVNDEPVMDEIQIANSDNSLRFRSERVSPEAVVAFMNQFESLSGLSKEQ